MPETKKKNPSVERVAHALRNMLASLGAGVFLLGCVFTFTGIRHWLGTLELNRWPVIAGVTVCEGQVGPGGECLGQMVTYKDFEQKEAHCDGRDAIVSGTLSKVRSDAIYVQGGQVIYFGDPKGRFRRTAFEFLDDDQGVSPNRPVGIQDWGPWRLTGGCVTEYRTWFTTVQHKPWHGVWNLPTTVGPFLLPRAKVQD